MYIYAYIYMHTFDLCMSVLMTGVNMSRYECMMSFSRKNNSNTSVTHACHPHHTMTHNFQKLPFFDVVLRYLTCVCCVYVILCVYMMMYACMHVCIYGMIYVCIHVCIYGMMYACRHVCIFGMICTIYMTYSNLVRVCI
jgi:hypothetical protein